MNDPAELAARFFRALYRDQYDLHMVNGKHVAVPAGTVLYAADTLTSLAWQIARETGRDDDRPVQGRSGPRP